MARFKTIARYGAGMRKPALVISTIALALTLAVAAPASAATPNAVLKSQLRAQKAKVAKLTKQLGTAKTTIRTLNGQVATLTTQNTTLTGEASASVILNSGKDATITSLQTQNATLTAQVSAQAAGGLAATLAGSPTDLWNAIAAIYPYFPNSSGCGLSKSYYASAPYFNYSFTSFGC